MNHFKGTFTQTRCLQQHFLPIYGFYYATLLCIHRKQLSVCDCGDVWCTPLSCTHLFKFDFIFGTLGRPGTLCLVDHTSVVSLSLASNLVSFMSLLISISNDVSRL